MNYLLDTHTFLWFITDDKAFITSVWEIAINTSLGKVDVPAPVTTLLAHNHIVEQRVGVNRIVADVKSAIAQTICSSF
jgi:PIN domain nuclease of toxin-antitoxin system